MGGRVVVLLEASGACQVAGQREIAIQGRRQLGKTLLFFWEVYEAEKGGGQGE